MAVKKPYLNSLIRGLLRLLAAVNLLLYSLKPIQINRHLAAETLITKYLQNGTQINVHLTTRLLSISSTANALVHCLLPLPHRLHDTMTNSHRTVPKKPFHLLQDHYLEGDHAGHILHKQHFPRLHLDQLGHQNFASFVFLLFIFSFFSFLNSFLD